MPTKVWKCNHCNEGFNSKEEVADHESKCNLNETTKRCNTCRSYEETGYPISGSDMRCMNKQSPLYDKNIGYFMEDKNVEDFFPCPYWVKEIW